LLAEVDSCLRSNDREKNRENQILKLIQDDGSVVIPRLLGIVVQDDCLIDF